MAGHEHTGNCKEIFAMLSQYLDVELAPEACREIEEHLAGCPPCIEFTESLRKTVELCRRHRPADMPDPLGREARERLRDAYQKMLASRKGSE